MNQHFRQDVQNVFGSKNTDLSYVYRNHEGYGVIFGLYQDKEKKIIEWLKSEDIADYVVCEYVPINDDFDPTDTSLIRCQHDKSIIVTKICLSRKKKGQHLSKYKCNFARRVVKVLASSATTKA